MVLLTPHLMQFHVYLFSDYYMTDEVLPSPLHQTDKQEEVHTCILVTVRVALSLLCRIIAVQVQKGNCGTV